jgi:hypothetical protein
MTTIDSVLNEGEKIIWRARPKFWPFVLQSFFGAGSRPGTAVTYFYLIVYFFVLSYSAKFSFLYFMIIVVIGLLLLFLYPVLLYKKVEYAITDKRIVLQKGVIGRDFDSIDFDKIQDMTVNVGVTDKIFGTGSISSVSAGESVYTKRGYKILPKVFFRAISQPYEVYKILKQVTFDIKAEMQFPSAYRPKTTKGYNTEYEPEDK